MNTVFDSPSDAILSVLYDRYFAVVPADTPDLLDAAHALRYQVYCVEHAFEDPAQQLGQREWDRCDAQSVHSVLVSKPSGNVVGCVRLILPEPGGPCASLPIRKLLSGADCARLDTYEKHRTAEISRYAIAKTYRRRQGESLYPDVEASALPANELRRLMPHMSLGLIRGICLLAARHEIETVCAAMAPSLLRLLERFGLVFERLGPVIDHHGPRQPCVASCEELLAGMAVHNWDYYQVAAQAFRDYGHAPPREPNGTLTAPSGS
jgi:N-acyl amino acid synthase of PEP-CTERM/exosortase system